MTRRVVVTVMRGPSATVGRSQGVVTLWGRLEKAAKGGRYLYTVITSPSIARRPYSVLSLSVSAITAETSLYVPMSVSVDAGRGSALPSAMVIRPVGPLRVT